MLEKLRAIHNNRIPVTDDQKVLFFRIFYANAKEATDVKIRINFINYLTFRLMLQMQCCV